MNVDFSGRMSIRARSRHSSLGLKRLMNQNLAWETLEFSDSCLGVSSNLLSMLHVESSFRED